MKRVLVVGSLNMDMTLDVMRMPILGESILGKRITYNPGGKGANQAYAAARLGGDVIMLGAVGKDDFGGKLCESLEAVSVNTTYIQRTDVATGTADIYVTEEGKNAIVVLPLANELCSTTYIEQHDWLIEQSDYLLLQMEIPLDTVFYTIRRGHALGKTIILNPAPAPEAFPANLLPMVDYLTPNEHELAAISGKPCKTLEEIQAAALELAARGRNKVIVTLGNQGALLAENGETNLFPVKTVPVVDTTAAGDCFNAAFVVALSEGEEQETAIRFANAAASVSVMQKGAQCSLPTRAQAEALL